MGNSSKSTEGVERFESVEGDDMKRCICLESEYDEIVGPMESNFV